jgi:hypothetical protein
VLDRDRVGIGIEIAQGLEFGDPGAKHLVAITSCPASL